MTSNSAKPESEPSCVFFKARNLMYLAITDAKFLICQKGLFLMFENSPSLIIFQLELSAETSN